jgi:predicted O-methyltransferase YrrM
LIRFDNLLRRGAFKVRQALWARRVAAARKVLSGDRAWQAMDSLGIPGFGTELLRVDFLSDGSNVPAWDESDAIHARLAACLDLDAALQAECLAGCLGHAGVLATWPAARLAGSPLPWLDNEFLSPLDMVALYGMIREFRPGRYVEIGCGISTRVALAAVRDGGLRTRMTCVDPAPRVDLPAAEIGHRPVRLESAIPEVLELAEPGSILFFDGSHRSFPGSDVTLFFLDLLPALRPGVVVHIHDIFLPGDYPADRRSRYWSEQYLLASWLLAGAGGFEILLPGARLEARPDGAALIPPGLRPGAASGGRFSSFWMRKR